MDATPAAEPSRWVAQGVIVDEIGIGLWLKTDKIQEIPPLSKGEKKHVDWTFNSYSGGSFRAD